MAIDFPTTPTTGQTYSYQGKVWQYNGTGWALISGGTAGMVVQVFTSTAGGTYTPSPGMKYCAIECVGGGGGGGGVAASSGVGGGGGGGGGSYSYKLASASQIGASQTVTVGSGGGGGTAGDNDGNAGGDTSVGTLCIGKGGSAGSGAAANKGELGGAGGVAGTGDVSVPGGKGGTGVQMASTTDITTGGAGGTAGLGFGAGALVGSFVANGSSGSLYGGGGSGGQDASTGGAKAGGSGANGIVFITEFLGAGAGTSLFGPGAATDNAFVRWDGTTGTLVQNSSSMLLGDDGTITWQGTVATLGGSPMVTWDCGTAGNVGITLRNTNSGSGGPAYYCFHDSSSPAASDVLGHLEIYGRNSSGAIKQYGNFQCIVGSPTSGAEYANWILTNIKAGTVGNRFRFAGVGAFNAATSNSYDLQFLPDAAANLTIHHDGTLAYIQTWNNTRIAFQGQGGGCITVFENVATAAGGSSVFAFGSTGIAIYWGSGVPTVTGCRGSLYMRTDGGATNTRMYVNTLGTSVWTAVLTAA